MDLFHSQHPTPKDQFTTNSLKIDQIIYRTGCYLAEKVPIQTFNLKLNCGEKEIQLHSAKPAESLAHFQ